MSTTKLMSRANVFLFMTIPLLDPYISTYMEKTLRRLILFHQSSSTRKAWLIAEAQSDGSDLVPWDAGLKKQHSG